MLYPEINKLRDIAGSRYFLVSMASKRARDIIDGSLKLDERIKSNKPVSIAAEEIAEELFTYKVIEDTDGKEKIAEVSAEIAKEADDLGDSISEESFSEASEAVEDPIIPDETEVIF